MNKKFFSSTIILLFAIHLSAQDIKYFFKILPPFYTEELDAKTKDFLLKREKYYPPSNDSIETVVYRLEYMDLNKSFLRIEMSFESGQRGFSTFELRSFKTKAGNSIVVFSNFSGVPVSFNQNKLSVFSYTKNKGLSEISSLGLLTNVSIKNFFNPNTPDSIKKKYENYCSIGYQLGYDGDISLNLYCQLYFEELYKWLAGDKIKFLWNGNRFIKQNPIIED